MQTLDAQQQRHVYERLVRDFEAGVFEPKVYYHTSTRMKEIPDGSIQLIVTSPPYNVGKNYGQYNDLKRHNVYLNALDRVWKECMRVLCKGGRIAINVANIDRKPYRSLSSDITAHMNRLGFKMRGDVIWDKGASVGVSTVWGSWRQASNPVLRDVHEHILVFSKQEWKLESPSHHVSTITPGEFTKFTKSIWSMATTSRPSHNHPTPFPIELPRRLIQLYTYVDDTVLDPFLGSGTTCMAAKTLGRKSIGYEINREFREIIESRMAEVKTLALDPTGIRRNGIDLEDRFGPMP